MNDRYKFRAYHKKWKLMYEVLGFYCDIVYLDEGDNGDVEVDIDEIELIQCTGLQDKHGKLIYEGDIVKSVEPYRTAHLWNPELKIIGNIYENK